jgi:hypothetical protein
MLKPRNHELFHDTAPKTVRFQDKLEQRQRGAILSTPARMARKGFESLLRKVKPGGCILIGLYNSYGRLPTLWRRRIFERFGQRLYFFDSRLTSAGMNEGRWQAWSATNTDIRTRHLTP